jgi:hypothetical protein
VLLHAVLLHAAPALAAPASALPARAAVRLAYTRTPAAARCPPEQLVRDEVARRLGYDPFVPDAADQLTLTLSLARTRDGASFVAAAELRDPAGALRFQETLRDPGCAALVSAMATSIALELTPISRPAPPLSPAPPAPAGADARSAPPGPATALARGPRLQMALSSSFAVGATPSTAAGLAWSIGGRWPSVSVGLEGRGLVSTSSRIENMLVQTSYLASAVAICGHAGPFFGCGRVEAGALIFDPEHGYRVTPEDHFALGLAARGGAEWAVDERFAVRGYADLLGPLTRTHLRDLDTGRILWSTPRASLAFGLGVVATF